MSTTNECPEKHELTAFASGKLPEAKAMLVQKHIQGCNACDSTVASLSSDTVIEPAESSGDGGSQFSPLNQATNAPAGLESLMAGLQQIPDNFQKAATVPNLQSQLAVGTILRNYVLVEKIAESGMGVVYKARHQKLGSPVALKVLRPHVMQDPASIERFHQEVAASGKLEHPNIVLARDADEVDGVHFLVMELVDGQDLSKLVNSMTPLAVPEACEIIRQAAQALQHVDDNGMVHRDIKPSNLMLTKNGRVKLLDLGLAKLREDKSGNEENSITSTGQVMGTVDYMSPEQANDSRTADIRADIYSLGCTLHFLLTGKAPFRREGKLKTLLAHTSEPPPKLPDNVPSELNDVYLQILSKEPAQRPRPPQVIAEQMSQFAAGADLAKVHWPTDAVEQKAPLASQIDTTTTAGAESVSVPPTVVESMAGSHRPQQAQTLPSTQSRPAGTGRTAASAPQPATATQSGRGNRIGRKLLALAMVPLAVIFGVIIYVETDKGTLKIEVADDIKDDVTVNVLSDDRSQVEGWQISSDDNSRRIRTGKVEVEIAENEEDKYVVNFVDDRAALSRGGAVLVTISRKTSAKPRREQFALLFDGHDDYVTLAGDWPEATDPITIECWCTPRQVKNNADAVSLGGIHLGWFENNARVAAFGKTGSPHGIATVRSNDELAVAQRTHLAAVYDGLTIRLFVDGHLQSRNADIRVGQLKKVLLGAAYSSGEEPPHSHVAATIDEVRVSRCVRYRKNFMPPNEYENDDDTLALYHFDEGRGTTLTDASGNGHHGTIYGATWFQLRGNSEQTKSVESTTISNAGSGSTSALSFGELSWAPLDLQIGVSEKAGWELKGSVVVHRASEDESRVAAIGSTQAADDFDLRLEFRFPNAQTIGNGGAAVLLHTNERLVSKPSMKGVEVRFGHFEQNQLLGTGLMYARDIWAFNSQTDALNPDPVISRRFEHVFETAAATVGEWHRLRITKHGGHVCTFVDGDFCNEAITRLKKVHFGFISRNTEIEIRNFRLNTETQNSHRALTQRWQPAKKVPSPDSPGLGLASVPAQLRHNQTWNIQVDNERSAKILLLSASHDRKTLVATLSDGTTRVLDADGRTLRTVETQATGPEWCRVSNDRHQLLVRERGLWDLSSDLPRRITLPAGVGERDITPRGELQGHQGGVFSFESLSDEAPGVRVLEDGKHAFQYPAMSPDGRFIVGWPERNVCVCFSVEENKELWSATLDIEVNGFPIWAPEEDKVIVSTRNGLVAFDARSGQQNWTYAGSLQKDVLLQKNMLICRQGNAIKRIRVGDGRQMTIQGCTLGASPVDDSGARVPRHWLLPNDTLVCTVNGQLRCFSTINGEPLWSLQFVQTEAETFASPTQFSAAGNWLNPDPEMEKHLRWMKWDGDVATAVPRKEIEDELDAIEAERVAAEKQKTAQQQIVQNRKPWPKGPTRSEKEKLHIPGLVDFPTELPDGRKWNMIREAPPHWIHSVRWSHDGAFLAVSASSAHYVSLYTLEDDKLILSRVLRSEDPEYVTTYDWCEFSPDGNWLAAGDHHGRDHVVIWDIQTGKVQLQIPATDWNGRSTVDAQWACDSDRLYVAMDRRICVVGLDGIIEQLVEIENDEVSNLAVSEKHGRIYVITSRGRLLTFDFDGVQLAEDDAHVQQCELLISHDERFLFLEAQTNGRGHRIWEISTDGNLAEPQGVEAGGWHISCGNWHCSRPVLAVAAVNSHQRWVFGINDFSGTKPKTKIIGSLPNTLLGNAGPLCWHPTKPLICRGFESALVLIDTDSGEYKRRIVGGEDGVSWLSPTPSGLAVSTRNGQSFLLGLAGRQVARPYNMGAPHGLSTDIVGDQILARSRNNDNGRWINLTDLNSKRRLDGFNVDAKGLEAFGDYLSYVESKASKYPPLEQVFNAWNPFTDDRWELPLTEEFRRYEWTPDTSKIAMATEGMLRIYEFGQTEPKKSFELPETNFASLAWNTDGTRLCVLTQDKILCFDDRSDAALWEISRPKITRNSLWFAKNGLLCRTDGKAIYHHDPNNGGPLSLKTVTLDTKIGTPTPIADNSLLVDNRRVVDAKTGKLQWSFMNGSDRSGTPVLIRWRPSGQLINPEEAAEQVYYLVESKDRPGQVDVLQHHEFIKLLPDELRKSEEGVFDLAP